MGLFDLFKRKETPTPFRNSTVKSSADEHGLTLTFVERLSANELEALLDVDPHASTEEKLLRGYLSDLFIEKKCEISAEGVLIPWDRFYDLLDDAQHSALVPLLGAPEVRNVIPILRETGTVSDQLFSVYVSDWLENDRVVDIEVGLGPLLRVGGELNLFSREVRDLHNALRRYFPKPALKRSQHENELAWGVVRDLAIRACARFGSRYLETTIVITPETLRLPTRRHETKMGRVYEVQPTFDQAPDGWLAAFDRFQTVQEHYDITKQGGRIRVILSEPVRKVLDVVKREMPGRKVAGFKAERFVNNPQAFLGDYAEGVLQVHDETSIEIDEAKRQTSFYIDPSIHSGFIKHASLVITEFYADGNSRSHKELFELPEQLLRLIRRLEEAIKVGRLMVAFNEFDLSIDANAEVQLERMKQIAHAWEHQGDELITLDDIYELSDYSDRIQGIGVATPIYIPVLRKANDGDEEGHGWLPSDLTPMLKVILPGSSEAVLIPVTTEWVNNFEELVGQAESQGLPSIKDPAIPVQLETPQARVLLDGFKTLLQPTQLEAPRVAAKGGEIEEKKPQKETLLVKNNFHTVDYLEARKALLSVPKGFDPKLPTCLRPTIQLKTHQRFGVAWFQHLYSKAPNEVRGCLLADDMGLGKTLQLLIVLAEIYEENQDELPSLIIVPKTLLQNWDREVEKFFNRSFPRHLVLYGDELKKRKQPRAKIDEELRTKGIADLLIPNWVGQNKVIITTYDVLTGFDFSFAKQGFAFVICDEAQRIKNPAANVSRSVRKLKAKFRVACTGTPVENSLVDLWCLFDFFQPGLLGSLDEFFRTYRRPIECKSTEQKDALTRLQALIRPQTLRRTKADIASDLKKKFFAVSGFEANEELLKSSLEGKDLLRVNMSDKQRIKYKDGLRRLQDARQLEDGKRRGRLSFEALHFMKAICAEPYCLPRQKFVPDPGGTLAHLRHSPKLAWLLDRLNVVKSKGEKAIVFTEIREIQLALKYFLGERFGLKCFIVNGESENRQIYIDKFSANVGFDVIILSPLAAGAGLNVVAANHVFHFTRAWNPAKESQATDRAFRIGQEKDVIVYCPTIVDPDDSSYVTFEQRLDQLLKEKAALANSTMDGDEITVMLNGSSSDVGFTEFMAIGSAIGVAEPRLLSIADIDRLDGNSFEVFASLFYSKQGFLCHVTEKKSGDGGVDVVAINGSLGLLVQCKSSQASSVGWDAIKELAGGAMRYQARFPGVSFIKVAFTNQRFNFAAAEQAKLNQVQLIQRQEIEAWLSEFRASDHELDELLLA